jgi:hypothetical protein
VNGIVDECEACAAGDHTACEERGVDVDEVCLCFAFGHLKRREVVDVVVAGELL